MGESGLMARAVDVIEFTRPPHMADRLADVVEANLARAIAERGQAGLAVSGGSTPAGLYRTMSQRMLPWSKVTATLVDERWVPPGAEGSNETFVRGALGVNAAKAVNIVGMWRDALTHSEAEAQINTGLRNQARPFDAVILGMGNDGHTASWFPHAQGLEMAVQSDRLACAVTANPSEVVGAHRERMTLTLAAIEDARFICLLLSGAQKRAAFEKACADGPMEDMPVRAILDRRPDIWVCWSP